MARKRPKLGLHAEALKEAIRRSAANPALIGVYEDLESEILYAGTSGGASEHCHVIHENIDYFRLFKPLLQGWKVAINCLQSKDQHSRKEKERNYDVSSIPPGYVEVISGCMFPVKPKSNAAHQGAGICEEKSAGV